MATSAARRLRRSVTLLGVALPILGAAAGCSLGRGASAEELLRRGDRYAGDRQYRAAAIEYRNAIKRQPNSAPAHRKLADTYVALRQPDKALESYVRAVELDRSDLATHLKAGSLFLLFGDFDRAATQARNALDLDANNIDAHILLANALAGVQNLGGALADLEYAVTLNPGEWRGHTALGQLQWIGGNKTAAEASYRKAIELAPQSASAHLAIGQFYWGSGRVKEAGDELQQACTLEPKSVEANGALAEFYMRTGRADRAEPYWRVVAADGADDRHRFALADYYALVGRTDDALAIVKPLADAKDKDGAARVRLAAILYDKGDRDGATRVLDALLRERHDDPTALLVKSRIALDAHQWEESRQAASTVLATHPDSWVGQYMLGLSQLGSKDFAAASRSFSEAVRLNPREVAPYVRRAEALAASGDPWNAIRSLERAFPNQSDTVAAAANNLAWALGSSGGDLRAAATLAQEAAGRLKKRPEPLDTLGWIYLQQGEKARAADLFRASLRLAPDNETYRKHLAAATGM